MVGHHGYRVRAGKHMGRRSSATLMTHLVLAKNITVLAAEVFEKNIIVCLVLNQTLNHLIHATSS